MSKKLIKSDGEIEFFLFKPDICHLYDKEKPGREEPVHRYTLTHIIHQYIYLIHGYRILYLMKNNEVVSYVIYTRCRKHVFNSGNKNDYYVIFYYTYPEYRGYGYLNVLMKTLFSYLKDNNDFYAVIAQGNHASIRAAEKSDLSKTGLRRRVSICIP